MVRSNHNKMEKRPEKTISWWQHHLHIDVVVQKSKYPCCHAEKVVNTVVVALIFNRAAMEKTNPSCLLAVVEEEEINPQYQETWYEETLTLRTRSNRKTY